jgi:hypothetical protein
MLSPPILHSFDEAELHAMQQAYLHICGRLNVPVEDREDVLRIRIARVIVDLAQSGIKPENLEAQAMAKLGI